MPQSIGISTFAKKNKLGHNRSIAMFERGELPKYVGKVQHPPISLGEFRRRNGISQATARRFARTGKLPPGVIVGFQRKLAFRDPFWATPQSRAAVWAELETNRKLLQECRTIQKEILKEFCRVRGHIDAVVRLRKLMTRYKIKLTALGKSCSSHTRKFARQSAAIRMSSIVLSTKEAMRFGKALQSPGSALARKRWDKAEVERRAAGRRELFLERLNKIDNDRASYANGHAIPDAGAPGTEKASTRDQTK